MGMPLHHAGRSTTLREERYTPPAGHESSGVVGTRYCNRLQQARSRHTMPQRVHENQVAPTALSPGLRQHCRAERYSCKPVIQEYGCRYVQHLQTSLQQRSRNAVRNLLTDGAEYRCQCMLHPHRFMNSTFEHLHRVQTVVQEYQVPRHCTTAPSTRNALHASAGDLLPHGHGTAATDLQDLRASRYTPKGSCALRR